MTHLPAEAVLAPLTWPAAPISQTPRPKETSQVQIDFYNSASNRIKTDNIRYVVALVKKYITLYITIYITL